MERERGGGEETKKKKETFVKKSSSKMGTDETSKHLSFAMIPCNLSRFQLNSLGKNSLSFDIVLTLCS